MYMKSVDTGCRDGVDLYTLSRVHNSKSVQCNFLYSVVPRLLYGQAWERGLEGGGEAKTSSKNHVKDCIPFLGTWKVDRD